MRTTRRRRKAWPWTGPLQVYTEGCIEKGYFVETRKGPNGPSRTIRTRRRTRRRRMKYCLMGLGVSRCYPERDAELENE